MKDILPGILLAVFMGFCVYPIQLLGFNDFVTLLIQASLGAAVYIAGSKLLKLDAFVYLLDMIKHGLRKEEKSAT